MKFDKENFLKTKLGKGIVKCVDDWDLFLDTKDYISARLCQKQWEIYQMAIKQFYGIDYHFTRTDKYYGIVTEDDKNWLYKIERDGIKHPRVSMYEELIKLGYTSDEALELISKMNFAEDY